MKAAYNDYCIEVTEDQSSAVLSFEETRTSESSVSVLASGAVDVTSDYITNPGI
jgi:hypothetical protein